MCTTAIRLLFLLAVSFSACKAALTEGNETKPITARAVVQQEVTKPGKINSTRGSVRIIVGATAPLEDSSKLLSAGEQPYQRVAADDKIKRLVSQRINILEYDGDPKSDAAKSSGDSRQRLLPKSTNSPLGWLVHSQGTRRPLVNFGNPGIADFLIMAGLGSMLNPLQHPTVSVPVREK